VIGATTVRSGCLPEATGMAGFDDEAADIARKAFAAGQSGSLYVMVPAMDGGQTYEMRCKICGETANILASRFDHADGCPVGMEERKPAR
jgi:hypothetical protein